jgi:hypothetical protein
MILQFLEVELTFCAHLVLRLFDRNRDLINFQELIGYDTEILDALPLSFKSWDICISQDLSFGLLLLEVLKDLVDLAYGVLNWDVHFFGL